MASSASRAWNLLDNLPSPSWSQEGGLREVGVGPEGVRLEDSTAPQPGTALFILTLHSGGWEQARASIYRAIKYFLTKPMSWFQRRQ